MDIFCSQSSTVTGQTLKPLALSRSACAESRVAMLRRSLFKSMLAFQSLSASTFALWIVFIYNEYLLVASLHIQLVPPITLAFGIIGLKLYICLQL